MKQFVITVGLFVVSSLANANLALDTITPSSAQQNNISSSFNHPNNPAIGHLIDAQLRDNQSSKIEVIYSTLFEYSSHVNQTIDHNGLSVFWNHALISTAIDAAQSQQHFASASIANDNNHDLVQLVANSLNDDYVNANNADNHINEVPLPAAIWLFSSALMLFGFARRSSV